MREYNKEQLDTLVSIRGVLGRLDPAERNRLVSTLDDYLGFREKVSAFLTRYFSTTCTRNCYENDLSACCSREGIITFFADVAVNALCASPARLDKLMDALQAPYNTRKCVYLGPNGCLWKIKPIVCEMFLCDTAKQGVFNTHPEAASEWASLEEAKKTYTWPDKPVLFDDLEAWFIRQGCISPLMYMHNSPGLLHIKKKNANPRQ